jgi:hypothetical protein
MPKKYEEQILAAVGRRSYQPLKPKALARKLGVSTPQYPDYRKALKELLHQGRLSWPRTTPSAPPRRTAP